MKETLKSLTERERDLVDYCIGYGSGKQAGLPGHTLMLLISKLWTVIVNLNNELAKGKEGE